MSMLAEPRKKQKISPDPRNLFWSSDDNKYGQRMLQKMGWEPGKGLGSQEDGRTEHITVMLKTDNKGVGCSQKYDDTWIAHQDDFADLLTSLNENHATDESTSHDSVSSNQKVMSLEEKSLKAKGRVHYKKFTKGKDLSRRTAKDMGCIFGSRRDVKAETKCVTENPDCEREAQNGHDGDELDDKTHPSSIPTVTSTESMQTYFAKKMEEVLKKNRLQTVDHGDNCVIETSSSSEQNGESLSREQMNTDPLCSPDIRLCQAKSVTEEDTLRKKKKKSKKSKSKSITDHTAVDSITNIELMEFSREHVTNQDFQNIGKTCNSGQITKNNQNEKKNKKRKHSNILDCKSGVSDLEPVMCNTENSKCDPVHEPVTCDSQCSGKIKKAKKKKLKRKSH